MLAVLYARESLLYNLAEEIKLRVPINYEAMNLGPNVDIPHLLSFNDGFALADHNAHLLSANNNAAAECMIATGDSSNLQVPNGDIANGHHQPINYQYNEAAGGCANLPNNCTMKSTSTKNNNTAR